MCSMNATKTKIYALALNSSARFPVPDDKFHNEIKLPAPTAVDALSNAFASSFVCSFQTKTLVVPLILTFYMGL